MIINNTALKKNTAKIISHPIMCLIVRLFAAKPRLVRAGQLAMLWREINPPGPLRIYTRQPFPWRVFWSP